MAEGWHRRRVLGGLIAAIVAPVAGLFGGRKAEAQGPMMADAGSHGEYQYRYVVDQAIRGEIRYNDGKIRIADISECIGNWRDWDSAMQGFKGVAADAEEFGGKVRLERRWVITGPVEVVEMVESNVHRSGDPCSDCDRRIIMENFNPNTPPCHVPGRRPDECPNDLFRHGWHNWKTPTIRHYEGPDDPLRVVIPAGD